MDNEREVDNLRYEFDREKNALEYRIRELEDKLSDREY